MTEATISKRLHISGLTPALTPEDLSRRLSSFGTVKAMDGFGLLDGVGNPRKFGYVTIEAEPSKLAKCMNLLSGATWKGAKLRIGEAKPDFAVSLQGEREASPSPPKRRRLDKYKSRHAEDMSTVTPENAKSRPGWTVTESGRIIRPLRIRPDHPLPPLPRQASSQPFKKKTRPNPPPTRARRRKIDVMLWGSTHTKGAFLDVPVPAMEPNPIPSEDVRLEPHKRVDKPSSPVVDATPVEKVSVRQETIQEAEDSPPPGFSLQHEASSSLAFLQSMFDEGSDWDGRESIPSDVDEIVADSPKRDRTMTAVDEDFEVVKRDATIVEDSPMADYNAPDEPEIAEQVNEESPAHEITKTSLSALFAPSSEPAAFSLLDQLDLELDEDVPFSVGPEVPPSQPVEPTAIHLPTTSSTSQKRVFLDPKAPMFFTLPSSHAGFRGNRHKDWRSSGFYRTQTSDEIHEEWDQAKGELTKAWKKRWREASKLRRRRGGGAIE